MLEGIRAAQSTWLGKIATTLIFGVILLAFVVWGIGDVFRSIGTSEVARVGDTSISAMAYRQAYQTELQRLQQRARRPITHEEAHAIGLDSRVLTRMMSEAVLDHEAQKMGLAMSDQAVAKSIRTDPSFAGPGGGFDRARFESILRANNLTELSFVREQRSTYLRQELVQAMVGSLVVPAAALEALHRYEAETRSLDLVALTAAAAGPIPPPDDAALQAYYDAHKAAFTAPQYRTLAVLAVTPAALAKADAVSDADALALYEATKAARYATPERRSVEQLQFPTEADAAAFAARVGAGTSFADAAKAANLADKVVDLGSLARSAIYDRALADAAFALPPGGTSAPVKTAFGSMLVHVGAVEPASVKPFAEVAAALKAEIALKKAGEELAALRQKVEDARTSGKTLAEAAAAAGLEARTIAAVDAEGRDKAGQRVPDLPAGTDLLKAAFASDVGVDNDTVATADGGVVWYEVTAVEPTRQLTLADARAKVDAAWREEETGRRLADKAADLVKAIDAGGQTLEQTAASLGLALQHVGDAKRSGSAGLPSGVVAKVFDVPVGTAGSAPTGPASRMLFKVLDASVPPLDPDAPALKAIAERYRSALQDGIVNDYLGQMGAKLGTKVNGQALRAASGAGY